MSSMFFTARPISPRWSRSMLTRMRRVTFLWVLLILIAAARASAATDVVTMITGERIVGEIKKAEKDVLTIETTYSDSDFKIEWDQIASIESDRQFLIETFGGRRLSGPLKAEPAKKGTVLVGNDSVLLA